MQERFGYGDIDLVDNYNTLIYTNIYVPTCYSNMQKGTLRYAVEIYVIIALRVVGATVRRFIR
jgi:hypothetical protein